MTVNSYLVNLASTAIIRDLEQESIRRSVATLQTRLNQHFGDLYFSAGYLWVI